MICCAIHIPYLPMGGIYAVRSWFGEFPFLVFNSLLYTARLGKPVGLVWESVALDTQ